MTGRSTPAHEERRLSAALLRERADDTRQRLQERRSTNRLIDMLFRLTQLDREAGGPLIAGAMAFRFFLFLVPAAFVLVVGLGLGADMTDANVKDVARHAGITGLAASAIQSSADASTVTQWVTFVVASGALFFGAKNLLKVLLVAHALIWKLPLQKLRHPTRASLAIIGIVAAGSVLLELVYRIRSLSFVGWLVGLVLYTLIPAVGWLLCSLKVFPTAPGATWRDLWPGAALFGVGVEALHLATVLWFAPSTQSKSQAYGAIGVAITILLWAYMLGRLVTTSAALNAVVWHGPPHRPPGGSGARTAR